MDEITIQPKPKRLSKTLWFTIIAPFLYPLCLRGVEWLATTLAIQMDNAQTETIAQEIMAMIPIAAVYIWIRFQTWQPITPKKTTVVESGIEWGEK